MKDLHKAARQLWQQFAAMAMQGLLANGAGYDLTPERLAESSLAMTDALLEALERTK